MDISSDHLIVRSLGLQDYSQTLLQMQAFTRTRPPGCIDELWVVQHPSVYTQGQAGKAEHLINPGCIPIVQADRGGQVTYHGPGQLVVYTLLDINRKHLNSRTLVRLIERSLINLLSELKVNATAKPEAPGIYVENMKIASLGLRIKKGCSYHGLALNVAMDLSPFEGINPCGYASMKMTQVVDWCPTITLKQLAPRVIEHLTANLAYTEIVTYHTAWPGQHVFS